MKKIIFILILLFIARLAEAADIYLNPGENYRDKFQSVQSGDSFIIKSGNHLVGYQGDGNGCSWFFTWDCVTDPVPSGTPQSPTKIIFEAGAKLIGVERAHHLINLEGSKNVIIEGDPLQLGELTDGEQCGEFHPTKPCKRDQSPYGQWAIMGIWMKDAEDITLRNLNIHGFAGRGVMAGRWKNLTVKNVKVNGNVYAGWDGDLDGTGGNDPIDGNNLFQDFEVAYNGCIEDKNNNPIECITQGQGPGYSDGFTIDDAINGAILTLDNVYIHHNGSDGFDGLYIYHDLTIYLNNSIFEKNLGQQFKSAAKTTVITNSKLYGDCAWWDNNPVGVPGMVWCRANGNTMALSFQKGSKVTIKNTLFDKNQGDVVIETSGDSCDGTELIDLDNVTIQGGIEARSGEPNDGIYGEGPCGKIQTVAVNSTFSDLKNGFCIEGLNNACDGELQAPPLPPPAPITIKTSITQIFRHTLKYTDEVDKGNTVYFKSKNNKPYEIIPYVP